MHNLKKSETEPSLTVELIETITGVKSEDWVANCYGISRKITESGIVKGEAVYGKYLGLVHNDSPLKKDIPIAQRHGWIVSGSTIIDPTRWVFENVEPYIFFAHISHPEYDRGALKFRAHLESLGLFPSFPPFDDTTIVFELNTAEEQELFTSIWQTDEPMTKVSTNQLYWIANRSPDELGNYLNKTYEWLLERDLKALVPIDIQQMFPKIFKSK